jgi:hypothetical protein
MRARFTTVTLLAWLVLASACTGGASTSQSTGVASTTANAAISPTTQASASAEAVPVRGSLGSSADISDYRIPEDSLRIALGPTTSDFQKGLINDGVLTFSEYETAVFADVQCYADRGLTASPELDVRGDYQVNAAAPDSATLNAAYAACTPQYYDVVDFLWRVHTAPSVQEYAAATDGMAQCLIEAGFKDVPLHPDVNEGLHRQFAWVDDGHGGLMHPDGWWDCILRIRAEYQVPAFSG